MKIKKYIIIGAFLILAALGIIYFAVIQKKPPEQTESTDTYIFQSNPNPDSGNETTETTEGNRILEEIGGSGSNTD